VCSGQDMRKIHPSAENLGIQDNHLRSW
jgi:hypothetical protein